MDSCACSMSYGNTWGGGRIRKRRPQCSRHFSKRAHSRHWEVVLCSEAPTSIGNSARIVMPVKADGYLRTRLGFLVVKQSAGVCKGHTVWRTWTVGAANRVGCTALQLVTTHARQGDASKPGKLPATTPTPKVLNDMYMCCCSPSLCVSLWLCQWLSVAHLLLQCE
jgi:hypothetical protein